MAPLPTHRSISTPIHPPTHLLKQPPEILKLPEQRALPPAPPGGAKLCLRFRADAQRADAQRLIIGLHQRESANGLWLKCGKGGRPAKAFTAAHPPAGACIQPPERPALATQLPMRRTQSSK